MGKYIFKPLSRFNKILDLREQNTVFFIHYLTDAKQSQKGCLYAQMDLSNTETMGQFIDYTLSNHLCVSNDDVKVGVTMDFFDNGLKNKRRVQAIERGDNKELLYQKTNRCIYLK